VRDHTGSTSIKTYNESYDETDVNLIIPEKIDLEKHDVIIMLTYIIEYYESKERQKICYDVEPTKTKCNFSNNLLVISLLIKSSSLLIKIFICIIIFKSKIVQMLKKRLIFLNLIKKICIT